MKTITLQTESQLFESSDGKVVRYEYCQLESKQWVIFENRKPVSFFQLHSVPADKVVGYVLKQLSGGKDLNSIIGAIGDSVGKSWTIYEKVPGKAIVGTTEAGSIELPLLTQEFLDSLNQ